MKPTTEQYRKGQIIFKEGDKPLNVYIIKAGRVRVTRETQNKTIVLGEFGEGDFFGEMAVLTNRTRSATAVASEECTVTVIGCDDFLRVLESTPPWLLTMFQSMAARLYAMDERIGEDLFYIRNRVGASPK